MKSANSNNSVGTAAFLLVWLAGWSAGTLLFDGIAVWGLCKQFLSFTYAEVPGIVTKSDLRVDHDSDGSTYRLELEYSYEVNGIGHTNDRLQYGFASNDRGQVERMAKEYAVENSIVVYHDPANPKDSVLIRGVSAMDFFLPLFLIPFNVIMVGVFSFTVGPRVRGWFCKRPVTIKVRQRDTVWFAKVYAFLPIAAASVSALGLSFALIFVVGFGQLVLPAWILVYPAWCIVILGSLFAYFWTVPTVRLKLDEFHQRLTVRFPRQAEPEPTNLASIRSIETHGETVVLETESAPIKIACSSESGAAWLRDWLRERCGNRN